MTRRAKTKAKSRAKPRRRETAVLDAGDEMATQQSNRRYETLKREADDAMLRGDLHRSARLNLQAFQSAPSRWTDLRLSCLVHLSRCMDNFEDRDPYFEGAFAYISKDEAEPMHVRVVALICRANFQRRRSNYTKELCFARRAIALAAHIEGQERATEILVYNSENQASTRLAVGDFVDQVVALTERGLLDLAVGPVPRFDIEAVLDKMPGPRLPPDSEMRQTFREIIVHRCSLGGYKCEGCQKTPDELGMDSLFKCSRCKLCFYCSKACQAKQWKRGHKFECRKYGEISSGDWMLIHSLKNRGDLNGKSVTILGPVPEKEGRWEVRNLETAALLSIASKNLRHARPIC